MLQKVIVLEISVEKYPLKSILVTIFHKYSDSLIDILVTVFRSAWILSFKNIAFIIIMNKGAVSCSIYEILTKKDQFSIIQVYEMYSGTITQVSWNDCKLLNCLRSVHDDFSIFWA
jgi:hypothetical protein